MAADGHRRRWRVVAAPRHGGADCSPREWGLGTAGTSRSRTQRNPIPSLVGWLHLGYGGKPTRRQVEYKSRLAGPRLEEVLLVPTTDVAPYLLTIQEVADIYLRTTPKAVRRLIERHQLPGVVHVGRRVLLRRDRLLQFLSESSVPSPTENGR